MFQGSSFLDFFGFLLSAFSAGAGATLDRTRCSPNCTKKDDSPIAETPPETTPPRSPSRAADHHPTIHQCFMSLRPHKAVARV